MLANTMLLIVRGFQNLMLVLFSLYAMNTLIVLFAINDIQVIMKLVWGYIRMIMPALTTMAWVQLQRRMGIIIEEYKMVQRDWVAQSLLQCMISLKLMTACRGEQKSHGGNLRRTTSRSLNA